jgi:hypothetical protein
MTRCSEPIDHIVATGSIGQRGRSHAWQFGASPSFRGAGTRRHRKRATGEWRSRAMSQAMFLLGGSEGMSSSSDSATEPRMVGGIKKPDGSPPLTNLSSTSGRVLVPGRQEVGIWNRRSGCVWLEDVLRNGYVQLELTSRPHQAGFSPQSGLLPGPSSQREHAPPSLHYLFTVLDANGLHA